MAGLKLAKLPDRTPIKVTISVSPELNNSLEAYAEAYREAYGEVEKIGELIPYMLEIFLSSDRTFMKSRRGVTEE
jgi:hypothetical protein